jgi:hypothetical protein
LKARSCVLQRLRIAPRGLHCRSERPTLRGPRAAGLRTRIPNNPSTPGGMPYSVAAGVFQQEYQV